MKDADSKMMLSCIVQTTIVIDCDFTFALTMAAGFSGKICALSRCFSIRLGLIYLSGGYLILMIN